ncbi:MAG: hypothetical protein MHM6MM_000390 [Cercozoa sp. M6MM]
MAKSPVSYDSLQRNEVQLTDVNVEYSDTALSLTDDEQDGLLHETPVSPVRRSSTGKSGLLAVVLWFVFNTSISNVNKILMASQEFKFPLTLTCCHMATCFLMSTLSLTTETPLFGGFSYQRTPSGTVRMRIFALAATFALSVVLGNIGLKYVYPSFAQMIGAATPIATVFLAVTVQGKSFHRNAYLALIPVTVGAVMCAKMEVNFHVVGFIALLGALATRALKSVLGDILLSGTNKDNEGKLDSMNLLYYMSQSSATLLFAFALFFEVPSLLSSEELWLKGTWTPATDWPSWLILSSLNAFLCNLTNFLVTKHFSAVTLQVLGAFKLSLGIAVSLLVFHNAITKLAALGVVLIVFGSYQYGRWRKVAPSA